MNVLARTTLDLPAPLMREIKSRAALSGMSMKDFLAQLLARALHEPTASKTVQRKAEPSPDWMALVGSLKDSPRFKDDAATIQRKMRSEWTQRSA